MNAINGTGMEQDEWLDSKEARNRLNVSACDLSHILDAENIHRGYCLRTAMNLWLRFLTVL